MRDRFFELIVQEHREMVYVYCYSLLGEQHLAEEVAQEVFVAAYEKVRAGTDVRSVPAWLRGIARNLAAQAIRERVRDRRIIGTIGEATEKVFASLDEVSAGDLWAERLEALRRCRERLPKHQRRAIELHYDCELQVPEIAGETGWLAKSVHQLLWAARSFLRECVKKRIAEGTGS
jgi:RNA polymerase sigma-70 factor (ECF subfamily)